MYQGGYIFFQADVRIDTKTAQVGAHQFVKLPMVWQQRGAIAKSTDQGRNFSFLSRRCGESRSNISSDGPSSYETADEPARRRDDSID